MNLGAKVAVDKTSEYAKLGWDKTVDGFNTIKNNEKVQEFSNSVSETTSSIWGWVVKNTVGETPPSAEDKENES